MLILDLNCLLENYYALTHCSTFNHTSCMRRHVKFGCLDMLQYSLNSCTWCIGNMISDVDCHDYLYQCSLLLVVLIVWSLVSIIIVEVCLFWSSMYLRLGHCCIVCLQDVSKKELIDLFPSNIYIESFWTIHFNGCSKLFTFTVALRWTMWMCTKTFESTITTLKLDMLFGSIVKRALWISNEIATYIHQCGIQILSHSLSPCT